MLQFSFSKQSDPKLSLSSTIHMIQDYNEQHAEAIEHFRNEAKKAFATICRNFGLQEENVILTDTDNLFQVTFSNSKIRIIVEGINWGMNTAVHFGMNTDDSHLYPIFQLIKERKPPVPITGGQIDQLFGYANYLMTSAPDILQGETIFFNQQDALIAQEKENALKLMQEEATKKLAEGYLKIDNDFGETIWRKPRPSLLTYQSAKDKFPDSFEVLPEENEMMGFEQYEAVITCWKIDLEDMVKKDEVICEISTDKVSVEILAPETGRLVWLLEEGNTFKFSTCIALIAP